MCAVSFVGRDGCVVIMVGVYVCVCMYVMGGVGHNDKWKRWEEGVSFGLLLLTHYGTYTIAFRDV